MCTVTYLPLEGNSYILTHNRDERYTRSVALQPRKYIRNQLSIFYPKDSDAGGTWICTSECIFTLCLLNGADEFNGSINDQYPKSRGQVILDFFDFFDIDKMASNYDFSGYGPFTLIFMVTTDKRNLFKLTWDTKQTVLTQLNEDEAHIWSSSTLYNAQERAYRQDLFKEFLLLNPNLTKDAILNFHLQQFDNEHNEEGIAIDRAATQRKTVSVSCIVKQVENTCTFYYTDLINQKETCIRIVD